MALADRLQVQALRAFGGTAGYLPTAVGRAHVVQVPGKGELSPVLLMHGLGSSGADFYPLIRRLRPHVQRIVTVDMPGHGLSEVPREGLTGETLHRGMLELMDRVMDERMVLFGSSMGGMAAVRYASARPHRVRGLFLSSPAGGPLDRAGMRALMSEFEIEDLAEARRFMDRALAGNHPLLPLMVVGLRARSRKPWMRQLLADLEPAHLLDPIEVRQLRMPVLLSWGRKEAILPRAHLDFWRANLPPHAIIEEPDDQGHVPFLTHVDTVVNRLVRFLAEELNGS